MSSQRSISVTGYRTTMAAYLEESHGMLQHLLSEADFEGAFPHVFGHPSADDAVAIPNECGLLLRKAQMHINAVLRANKTNNLHSMAVQMRVVLECAAQIISKADAVCEGSRRAYVGVLNASEADYWDSMKRATRGRINYVDIMPAVVDAREGIGESNDKPPTRVTVADKISSLRGGKKWYDHLSKHFCDSRTSMLYGTSFYGGVMSIDTEADNLTFAVLLDYLTEQVIRMLFGYGFLLVPVSGNRQPFEEAESLLERKRTTARAFHSAGHKERPS